MQKSVRTLVLAPIALMAAGGIALASESAGAPAPRQAPRLDIGGGVPDDPRSMPITNTTPAPGVHCDGVLGTDFVYDSEGYPANITVSEPLPSAPTTVDTNFGGDTCTGVTHNPRLGSKEVPQYQVAEPSPAPVPGEAKARVDGKTYQLPAPTTED